MANPWRGMTPFEVRESVLPECPITSARRAMTNLTESGLLVKTDMRRERYGKKNHVWRLARRRHEQRNLFERGEKDGAETCETVPEL